jgi:hypothetical protein
MHLCGIRHIICVSSSWQYYTRPISVKIATCECIHIEGFNTYMTVTRRKGMESFLLRSWRHGPLSLSLSLSHTHTHTHAHTHIHTHDADSGDDGQSKHAHALTNTNMITQCHTTCVLSYVRFCACAVRLCADHTVAVFDDYCCRSWCWPAWQACPPTDTHHTWPVSSLSGASECSNCPAGTYQPSSGASTVESAALSSFSLGRWQGSLCVCVCVCVCV